MRNLADQSIPEGAGNGLNPVTLTAACQAGEVVLGGGYDATVHGDNLEVDASKPNAAGTGWEVRGVKAKGNTAAFPVLTVYAICKA